MIDRDAEYQSMVRRVEQAQKAISAFSSGRSRLAGTARALSTVLDEAHERMNLAWAVLTDQRFEVAQHYTYRAQKAAELGICYASIIGAYDHLCQAGIIGRSEQTELTLDDMVKKVKEQERVDNKRRRASR